MNTDQNPRTHTEEFSAETAKGDELSGHWQLLPDGPAWNDTGNWNQPQYYSTIQAADIDGDRAAELIARAAAGIVTSKYDPNTRTWHSLPDGPLWSDAQGWNQPQYYTTIQTANIDGDRDGTAGLIARAAAGITGFKYIPATHQ